MNKNVSLQISRNIMKTLSYNEGSGFMLPDGMYIPDIFIRTFIIVIVFYVAASFLLTLVRLLLHHRLKNKLIRQGRNADEIERIFRCGSENQAYAAKWFFLLSGTGLAFTIISFFSFGWPSMGVISAGLVLGHGAYFIYLKRVNREN